MPQRQSDKMDDNNTSKIFTAFGKVKVLVVGDVMTDHYIFGHVKRVSPEAPVPIVDVYKRENRLGGAANVALNLKNLGAKVGLCSVVGDDEEGHLLKMNLRRAGIDNTNLLLDQERRTTVKNRVVSRNHQMLRFDVEQALPLEDNTELLLLDTIIDAIYAEKPDVLVFQDYNKGVLTPKIIANVIHNCKQQQIPVAVDPKADNFFEYKGCTLFKPNLREMELGLGMKINPAKPSDLLDADRKLRHYLNHDITAVTLADKGIFVTTQDEHELLPAHTRSITDVSGAGDTVISLMALGLALGLDIIATAELANLAAGLVCEQTGVVSVNRERLMQEAAPFLDE